ncbi:hypothetical protein CTKZ_08430 [Cellulomonas algicola]|uniref:Uncharacterized protein n=1 Tax=Cellulomonas algicola TaxID=2071633 RepID=A0A401UX80_9CELL|nr:hypothetical protein CTKZ_08430 [Cellulomonas algicola]
MLRARLFLISYVPLLWIIALQHWPTGVNDWTGYLPTSGVLALSVIGLGDAFNLTLAPARLGVLPVRIENVTDEGANAAAYLVTYLLPFVSVSLDEWNAWAAHAVFFIVLFIIFVRSNFGLINPTMYLLGWKVIQADILAGEWGGHTRRVTLLAKEIPPPGNVRVRKMAGGFRLEE